jgi:hypothetical protein
MRNLEVALNDSLENLKWLGENYSRLKREYGDKWVVISSKKVVESGDSFEEILLAAKKYPPGSFTVEYIQSKEIAMFF